jgi:mRNA interferase RelE/StbE
MKYAISWAESAHREFSKLPFLIQRAIVKRLDSAAGNPSHYFIRLVNDPRYKLRVGDYRIIARIEHDKLLILVVEAGHRKNVYD